MHGAANVLYLTVAPVMASHLSTETIRGVAAECGFELCGVAPADPPADFDKYEAWVGRGMAGAMDYLTGRRAWIRQDVRHLLPSARSVICVGKLYNTGEPRRRPGEARISRYAAGEDYHDVMRASLKRMVERLGEYAAFDSKICVDTSPLLERTYARLAGLGWIGRNTCLINEPRGSWFFLGEIITSLALSPGVPPPDRCGTCTRCIDACPTQALVPEGPPEEQRYTLDSRQCISYLTIELRGAIPAGHRPHIGTHVFGCDICQDVCPWNADAPLTGDPAFVPMPVDLGEITALDEQGFRERFRHSPVSRAKYSGLLRNVAVVMGNIGVDRYREPLQKLARHPDPVVREHAEWALDRALEEALHRALEKD